jgi:hypothetical protein
MFAPVQDADLDLAAKNIIKGGYSYSGQRCTAVKVVLALEPIADELVKKVRPWRPPRTHSLLSCRPGCGTSGQCHFQLPTPDVIPEDSIYDLCPS